MRRPSLPPRGGRRPPRASRRPRGPLPRPPLRAVVAFAGVLAVLVTGWAWLRDSPLVAVRSVTVTGVSGPDAQQVRDALVAAARDMTTLHVRTSELRTAVGPYPGVLGVRTDADFPHGLHIAVRERNPVAAVVSGAQRVAVAADGTLMPTTPSAGLPEISARALPGGAHASAPDVRRAIAVLTAAPPALRPRVRRVYVGPHGITAPLRDGPTLYLGGSERLRAKWIAAATVLADRSSAGATYLDLRLPERPAAGGLEPPPVASLNGGAAIPGGQTTTPSTTAP
jgi:cell division protein FtsQ